MTDDTLYPQVLSDAILAAFPPNPDELLAVASVCVREADLAAISRADFDLNMREHLIQLRAIRDNQALPRGMEDIPLEVLQLTQWLEPNESDVEPKSRLSHHLRTAAARFTSAVLGLSRELPWEKRREAGHRSRAFACAVLLRLSAQPEFRECTFGDNQTLVQMIESAIELGGEMPRALACFLTWRILQLGLDEDRPFFIFGLLLLSAIAFSDVLDCDDLCELAELVVAEEAAARQALGCHLPEYGDRWLLGLTFYNQKHDKWRLLVARVRNRYSEFSGSKLLEIANRIDGAA